ncbi:MAG: 16S rRNA (uracil(1498)-N(3))-methyltransferase [Bacteroidales bacterium]|nr:16S rRNA (uracil(1498)-N(3))-methyltransferase [Bacteroidales bacterium]MBR4647603.1 16S rRNA (uracil(1498)-N(3))-methyltransferase [Bacteroidales bacterium]
MFVFYCTEIQGNTICLTGDDARHCAKVLRKRPGDSILLTDGCGTLAQATLTHVSPTDCVAEVAERKLVPPRGISLHLAVAPTKNADRMEWLVEKAVELGVERISFIICDHSERRKIDLDRMRRIAIAALKQSQTAWLPELQVISFSDFVHQADLPARRYVAWCDDQNTAQLVDETWHDEEVLLLIGPEGDFSTEEINLCKSLNYKEIKLGSRRLRTETAALYGCFTIAAKNN